MTARVFYAYVRRQQNIKDKVRPLEESAGNIISQGFSMAEFKGYFRSLVTREYISSLRVPYAQFQEAISDYLR